MADLRDDAINLLGAAARAVRTATDRRLAKYGVYAGQHLILACLWEEDGLTPSQVASRLALETPTVTRAVQRMEAAELIERRGDIRDGRLVRIWLLPKGRTMRRVIGRVTDQVRAEVFADLNPREQAMLANLLSKLTLPRSRTGSE
ncbi:MAG: MarR family winged helix-turn-helix transcriptional regulator [Mycobacteriales bacterium]